MKFNLLFLLVPSLVMCQEKLFDNGKNEDLFTITYNSCYVKQPDESYCIVTGVEHSTCSQHLLGIPNKCNDKLRDCKACLNRFLNMLRTESQNNFGIWCDTKNGYVTEYNSSSPVCQ